MDGDAPCWVEGCDGEHYDPYIHPRHVCAFPIEHWRAKLRRDRGQHVRGKVITPLPKVWRCPDCGRHWRRTKWDGWALKEKK